MGTLDKYFEILDLKFSAWLNGIESKYGFIPGALNEAIPTLSVDQSLFENDLQTPMIVLTKESVEQISLLIPAPAIGRERSLVLDHCLARRIISILKNESSEDGDKILLSMTLQKLISNIKDLDQDVRSNKSEVFETLVRLILSQNQSTTDNFIAIELLNVETFVELQEYFLKEVVFRPCLEQSVKNEKIAYYVGQDKVVSKSYKRLMNQIGEIRKEMESEDSFRPQLVRDFLSKERIQL